ncbi:MAG: chemotaxis protein CheD [Verrucomicrobiota bacterium]
MLASHLAGLKPTSIGIGRVTICAEPGAVLVVPDLGPGVAVVICDPMLDVAGVLHCLLPDSEMDRVRAATRPGLFLDTGLDALLEAAEPWDMDRNRMRVFAAGSARAMGSADHFNPGRANREALRSELEKRGLKLAAQHLNGFHNRSLYLLMETGELIVHVSGQAMGTVLCRNWTPI